jgi:hypothetical protein
MSFKYVGSIHTDLEGIMLANALIDIAVSSIELAAEIGVLYFLYSLWRDVKKAFFN